MVDVQLLVQVLARFVSVVLECSMVKKVKKSTLETLFRANPGLSEVLDKCVVFRHSNGDVNIDFSSPHILEFVEMRDNHLGVSQVVTGISGVAQATLHLHLVSEEVQVKRKAVCDACPHRKITTVLGLLQVEKCQLCSCFLAMKRKLKQAHFNCPLGKWDDIEDAEQ